VAQRVLDVDLDETVVLEELELLRMVQSMRAAVRSHVGLAEILAQPEVRLSIAQVTHVYFDLAETYLSPPRPQLIAVGGLSGTGKSSLARRLAPAVGAAPGARIIRTDVIRKQLAQADLHDRLPPECYGPEMSKPTYLTLYRDARRALSSGHSVVCDAVFANPEERHQVEALASEMNVPFTGFWLEAPESLLVQRVNERTGDVSDATADVVRQQSAYELGPITWHPVDATQNLNAMASQAAGVMAQDDPSRT